MMCIKYSENVDNELIFYSICLESERATDLGKLNLIRQKVRVE